MADRVVSSRLPVLRRRAAVVAAIVEPAVAMAEAAPGRALSGDAGLMPACCFLDATSATASAAAWAMSWGDLGARRGDGRSFCMCGCSERNTGLCRQTGTQRLHMHAHTSHHMYACIMYGLPTCPGVRS